MEGLAQLSSEFPMHTHVQTVIACLLLACSACIRDVKVRVIEGYAPFKIPTYLNGPIDQDLPRRGAIDDVRVRAGPSQNVAVVWTRTADAAVVASESAARATRETDAAQRTSERWKYGVPAGEFIAMCVLERSSTGQVHFLPRVTSDWGFDHWILGGLTKSLNGWELALAIDGIAVVPFNANGYGVLTTFVPEKSPKLTDEMVWITHGEDMRHVFWLEFYLPWFAFPDSGLDRLRMHHGFARPGSKVESRVAYQFEFHHGEGYNDFKLIERAPNRIDLVYESYRGLPSADEPLRSDLYHVGNVFRSGGKRAKRIATIENCAKTVCLPLDDGIQVIWMDDQGKEVAPLTMEWTGRFNEVHLINDRWSKQRRLFQSDAWDFESLAGTRFTHNGEERVLAIWRGENGRLTYTIRLGPDEWTSRVTADLEIGGQNWLAAVEDG